MTEFREYRKGNSVRVQGRGIDVRGKIVSFGEINGVLSIKIVGYVGKDIKDIKEMKINLEDFKISRTRLDERISKVIDTILISKYGNVGGVETPKEHKEQKEFSFNVKELPNVYGGELTVEDLEDLGARTYINYGDSAMYCIYIGSKGYDIVQESDASLLTEQGYTDGEDSEYLKFKDDGRAIFFPTKEEAIRGLRRLVHKRYIHPSIRNYNLPEDFDWV